MHDIFEIFMQFYYWFVLK